MIEGKITDVNRHENREYDCTIRFDGRQVPWLLREDAKVRLIVTEAVPVPVGEVLGGGPWEPEISAGRLRIYRRVDEDSVCRVAVDGETIISQWVAAGGPPMAVFPKKGPARMGLEDWLTELKSRFPRKTREVAE